MTGEHVFAAMTPPIDMNERLMTTKLLARVTKLMARAEMEGRGLIVLHVDPERV